MPDPPPGHRMRILGELPSYKESLCISLILKWTKKMCKICLEPRVCQEKWCLWGKDCTNSLLEARSIPYPEETISFFVQMLHKLAKEPYATAGRIFSQFGIWMVELPFNREKEKHMKMRNKIVSTLHENPSYTKGEFQTSIWWSRYLIIFYIYCLQVLSEYRCSALCK